ncbi:MAG: hypothetical protein ABI811_04170 [Acidobacteriota bacterium]
MKKFTFSLDRVLAWRQTQCKLEEAKLESLRAEGSAIDRQQAVLAQAVLTAGDSLMTASSVTSAEFAALEHYRAASARQSGRIRQARQVVEQKIIQQTQAVIERRRDSRLLERLRERRLSEWQASADREIEQAAAEAFLGRWKVPNQHPNKVE